MHTAEHTSLHFSPCESFIVDWGRLVVHAHGNTHVVDVSPTLLYVAEGVKNMSYEKDNAHWETQGIHRVKSHVGAGFMLYTKSWGKDKMNNSVKLNGSLLHLPPHSTALTCILLGLTESCLSG